MQACTFTIYVYGHSGNELPPPVINTHQRTMLQKEQETDTSFKDRMSGLGMSVRSLLREQFQRNPKPYSQASGCDWNITQVGPISDVLMDLEQ